TRRRTKSERDEGAGRHPPARPRARDPPGRTADAGLARAGGPEAATGTMGPRAGAAPDVAGPARGGGSMIRWMRIAFYWTIKTIAWPVTHSYLRLRVEGARHVPRRGACLVVANHSSYIDAIVLGSACPRRVTFLITRPIYDLWRLKWFYFMMGS